MVIKKAGCILINLNKKEIALVCRSNEYSFPKGHLKNEETLPECAIRETREETGHECHIINNKEIAILHYISSRGENVNNYFYIAIDDGISLEKIDEENKEKTIWKSFNDVENILSFQNLKDFWNDIKLDVKKVIDNG